MEKAMGSVEMLMAGAYGEVIATSTAAHCCFWGHSGYLALSWEEKISQYHSADLQGKPDWKLMLWLDMLGRQREWTDLKHSPSFQQQPQIKRVELAKQPFQLSKHPLGTYNVSTSLSEAQGNPKPGLEASPILLSENLLGAKGHNPAGRV